jgi:hypothetical protein
MPTVKGQCTARGSARQEAVDAREACYWSHAWLDSNRSNNVTLPTPPALLQTNAPCCFVPPFLAWLPRTLVAMGDGEHCAASFPLSLPGCQGHWLLWGMESTVLLRSLSPQQYRWDALRTNRTLPGSRLLPRVDPPLLHALPLLPCTFSVWVEFTMPASKRSTDREE